MEALFLVRPALVCRRLFSVFCQGRRASIDNNLQGNVIVRLLDRDEVFFRCWIFIAPYQLNTISRLFMFIHL